MADLNQQQRRFAEIILKQRSRNAKQAYIDAGYKARGAVAMANASRLLRNDKVQQFLDNMRSKSTEIAVQAAAIKDTEILAELKRIGFADLGDYFDVEDGKLIIRDFDQVDTKALASVKQKTTHFKGGESITIEVKLQPKLQALVKLGEYLGLFDHEKDDQGEEIIYIRRWSKPGRKHIDSETVQDGRDGQHDPERISNDTG
tara:strand:+ start:61 stop:666 length:606 start_codon:yes stop_codon:yes gene_type:complete